MKVRMLLVAAASVAVLAVTLVAADVKLEGVNCVVAGKKAAKEGNSVDYKGGKVFFCCMNCPKAFAADTAKFASKANHQLVATGQAKQTACPFTGKPTAEGTAVKVAGTEVSFCCNNCKGKAEKLEGDAKAEAIFNDTAFGKGFKVGAE
jgi:YHS domain-containing protein